MTAQRDFTRVLAAEGVSNFGAMLSRVAIPWLAALGLQASPLDMAGLLLADVAAGAVCALWLAPWIDRRGKRAVMLGCDAARAAILLLLAALAWRGAATMPVLVVAAACTGTLTMGFELARSAWMAQRVAHDDLVRRNAQLATTTSLSETAAFALGGWLFQGLGAALALVLDALSYAVSALCLRGVGEIPGAATGTPPSGAPARSSARAHLGAAFAGLRAAWAVPALRTLTVIEALVALALSLAGTCYMIYVTRDLGLAIGWLGLVFAVGGLGSVLGARLAQHLGPRLGAGRTITFGLAALAAGMACVPMAAAAGAWAWLWLVAHQIVGDGGHTLYGIHDRTLRQTQGDAAMLARIDGGMRGLGQLATLVGALAGGALGTSIGTQAVLIASGVVLAAAALFAASGLAWLGGPPALPTGHPG